MKKIFFITAIIFIFALLTTNSNAQTTVEEYNYVVKGYKVQMESGLDMKKGYDIVSVDEISSGERSVILKGLIKMSPETKIVAYMIIYKKEGSSTEYICIPQPNSDVEIRKAYLNALYNGEGDSSTRLQLIAYILSRRLIW